MTYSSYSMSKWKKSIPAFVSNGTTKTLQKKEKIQTFLLHIKCLGATVLHPQVFVLPSPWKPCDHPKILKLAPHPPPLPAQEINGDWSLRQNGTINIIRYCMWRPNREVRQSRRQLRGKCRLKKISWYFCWKFCEWLEVLTVSNGTRPKLQLDLWGSFEFQKEKWMIRRRGSLFQTTKIMLT